MELSEEREIKPAVNHVIAPPLPSPATSTNSSHSVVNVEDQGAFSRGSGGENFQIPNSRRVLQDARETRGNIFDHDEDKYKRRPASEWVRRWWK